jgi:phosphoserine phosphatase
MTTMTSLVLSLIARPGSAALDTGTVARIETMLPAHNRSQPRWLQESEAWECRIACDDAFTLDDLAVLVADGICADALGTRPVDVNILPGQRRRKTLLIADMDSTMIHQECIDEMADVLGLKPEIAGITERAMRGALPFEAALRERLDLIKGLSVQQLAQVYSDRITEMPGGRVLVATMKKHGALTALVSGGFTFFTSRVAHAIGFDENRANTLEIVDGVMTGGIIGPILGKEAKLEHLKSFAQARRLELADSLAVGDGANDLAMIGAAGLGVAYRAKPLVAAEAQASIINGDLTALLYLQGYGREEFAPL